VTELPTHTLRGQLEAAYLAIDLLDADRRRIRTELRTAKETLGEAEARADQAQSQAASDICRLSNERDALLLQIQQINASTSWRVTRPLRGIVRALRWILDVQREKVARRGRSVPGGLEPEAGIAKPVFRNTRLDIAARPEPKPIFHSTGARAA
jgi:hypothetical protein